MGWCLKRRCGGDVMTLRDEILNHLQLHGRQSARQVSEGIGRNPKLVMRYLKDLAENGTVVFDRVPEVKMLKLRYFGVRRTVVRYYRLPVRTVQRDPWLERWAR